MSHYIPSAGPSPIRTTNFYLVRMTMREPQFAHEFLRIARMAINGKIMDLT